MKFPRFQVSNFSCDTSLCSPASITKVRERIIVGLDYDNLNMIGYEDFQFQFNEVPVIEVLVLEVHERELEKVE
jgi:hypothetical protein